MEHLIIRIIQKKEKIIQKILKRMELVKSKIQVIIMIGQM